MRKKTIKKTVAPMMLVRPAVTDDMIAAKAYELYLARDGAHGHDLEDWLAAEAALTSSRA